MSDTLDATAMADLVERGEARPVELVEQAIERIEAANPVINAVIVPLFDEALAEAERARGRFRGVPYVLKDMNVAKGVPHACGIEGVRRAGYRSDVDSHFVASMREAGFVLVGVANTSEIGLLPTTEPHAWGATRNPWNTDHSTGGSSGGSAAAVASGMTPVAHASDGGGSTRIPASECGIIGLKPTRGRVSTGPLVRYGDDMTGLSHEGIHARTVRDVAALLDVLEGHRPGDAYWAPPPARPYVQEVGHDPGPLRVGVMTEEPSGQLPIDPRIQRVVREVAETLQELGHRVEDGFPEVLTEGPAPEEFAVAGPISVARELEAYGRRIGRELTEHDVEPFTWQLAQAAREVTGVQYAAAVDAARHRSAAVQKWWDADGWDLLLTPTLTILPPRIGEFEKLMAENRVFDLASRLVGLTMPYNMSGQPAISLPLGMSEDGLPIGIQLVAAYGRDDLLLNVAAQLEAARPWAGRTPPVASVGSK